MKKTNLDSRKRYELLKKKITRHMSNKEFVEYLKLKAIYSNSFIKKENE